MSRTSPDPTQRFSDRAEHYARCRPAYPEALLETLRAEAGLSRPGRVADVGSGTAISTALLLRAGCTVFGVEPNDGMRAAAERRLAGHPRFHSVAGTAEATTLPAASVDLVAAGQAFHWFEPEATRAEFSRILAPGGAIALFWNTRRADATPFLEAYEALLREFGTDYRQVDHRQATPERLRNFFAAGYRSFKFPNAQTLDYDGLEGRLLSSSYVPGAGDPRHGPMLRELRTIFDAHQEEGRVRLLYTTELHIGT